MNLENKEYDIAVANYDYNNSETIILNGNVNNAQSLFYYLIEGATKNINIISGKLESYNQTRILDALEYAINSGIKIKVLLDESMEAINLEKEKNNFLRYCINSDNCMVKHSSKHFNAHVITRDSKAYRYCKDPTTHSAIASFNGAKIAQHIDEVVFSKNEYSKYKTI